MPRPWLKRSVNARLRSWPVVALTLLGARPILGERVADDLGL